MIRLNTNRFAWAFVALAVLGLSGCKQISTRSTVAPSIAPPVPPYGYDPPDDTYLHRPEMAPRLEAVPNLPAPGHSIPTDPPPPAPAPDDSAALPTGDSVTASKAPWALRPMSFLNRKESKSEDRTSRTEIAKQQAILESKSPVLSTKPEGVRWTPSNREIVSSRPATSVASNQNLNPPSLDDSYTGPVITPGYQYTSGQRAPIENWPYANRSVAQRPTVHLRKQPEPVSSEVFVPVSPPKLETLPASVQPESSSATVPLLLPPGA
ncbi:MAG TPA: hypothetical protein VGM98_25740 [Schlesneria sp.]|jgi:hypothetical protein